MDQEARRKSAGARKVFWSTQEWLDIARTMVEIQTRTPALSKLSVLEQAQQTLRFAPERRRKPNFWSEVSKKLDPLLEQARDRLMAERQAQAALQAAQTREPAYPPEVQRALELSGKIDTWMTLTVELTTPLLLAVLSRADLREKIRDCVAGVVAAKSRADVFSTSFSALAEDSRKPKVLVAGLLPAQAGEVSSEFENEVEFRFWHTDESKDKLRTLAKNCDLAVGVTNFLSHPADASLQSLAPSYVRHTGGISRLKETIRSAVHSRSKPRRDH